jgi:drug/metabolite transporter (DMT)-like permease
LGIASGLSAAAIWGGMYVVSKVVLDVIPPFSLITLRLVLGALTLAVFVLPRKRQRFEMSGFWRVFGVGVIGYGISLGFQFVGTKMSTAANGALVTSATPAFVLPLAALILGERIRSRRILALAISTIGVVAVVDPRTARVNAALFWGNLALVAAAVTWALYSVLIRLVSRDRDVLAISLIAFLGGFPIAIPGGLIEARTLGIGSITPAVVLEVLFLGIIATALAMYLWNSAFALVEASRVSLTFFAQPVVGGLLGWLLLGERISGLFLLGGVLIAAGLVVASLDPSDEQTRPSPSPE